MFSTLSQTDITVLVMLKFSSANAFKLNQSRIVSFGKELSLFWVNLQITLDRITVDMIEPHTFPLIQTTLVTFSYCSGQH